AAQLSHAGLLRAAHRRQARACLYDGAGRATADHPRPGEPDLLRIILADRHGMVREARGYSARGAATQSEPRSSQGLVPRGRCGALASRPAVPCVHEAGAARARQDLRIPDRAAPALPYAAERSSPAVADLE